MALVAAGVANGGVIMEPHVAKQITNADGKVIQTIEAKPWKTCMTQSTADTITAMMVENVEHGTATGRRSTTWPSRRRPVPRRPVSRAQAPHAWFVAFAPADNPRFAVSVLIENGGNYGNDATGGESGCSDRETDARDIARPAMTSVALHVPPRLP